MKRVKRIISLLIATVLCITSAQFALPETYAEAKSNSNRASFNGHTYYVFNIKLEWSDAKEYCERLGGHLITVTSEEEQAMMSDLLANAQLDYDSYWMGANYTDVNTFDWRWVTGEAFEYTHFNERYLDGSGKYMQTHVSGEWDDTTSYFSEEGNSDNGFICEWDYDFDVDGGKISSNRRVFNGHTYYVFNIKLDWFDAKKYCESLGGHLITVTSEEEQAMMSDLLANAQLDYDSYWMGANYFDVNTFDWRWITGEAFEYTHFDEILLDGSGQYMQTHVSGDWDDTTYNFSVNGNSDNGFICEWEYNYVVDKDDLFVKDNSTKFNGHTYTVYNENLTWFEAKAYCENQGGHLITITTEEEQSMIEILLSQSDLIHNEYWMGGSYSNNSWQWITGESFSFTHFDGGEPNSSGNYLQTYTSGLWDDTISTGIIHSHGFICEWDNGYGDIGIFRQNNTVVYNGKKRWEEVHFNYSLDDCLKRNSREYNPDLAYMLSTLANSAYNIEKVNYTLIKDAQEYSFPGNPLPITESLRNLGFNAKKNGDVEEYNYYSDASAQEYGEDTTAFTISTKVMDNGTRIILIVIRGSFGSIFKLTSDWKSNLNFDNWSVGLHEGFSAAKDEIIRKLVRFKASRNIEGNNIKYVLTGHSRAASVANLVSKELIDSGVSCENVYDYNFACPDTGRDYLNRWNPGGIYDSIFNINNVRDIIGVIPGYLFTSFLQPLSNENIFWGKYGRTFFFSKNWNTVLGTSVMAEHDMNKYVEQMSKKESTDSFKSWEEARMKLAQNYFKTCSIFLVFCPVDFEIIDSNGIKVAEVSEGDVNYFNNSFGDVVILVAGDQKAVYLSGADDYYIKMTGTDTGTMKYCIGDAFSAGEETTGITYSEVSVTPNKKMLSIIDNEVSVGEIDLISLNEELQPDMKIGTDGVESPMDDETKEKYINLPLNETQFSISYELNGGEDAGNPTVYTVKSEDITLTDPQKDNCVFVGWTGSNGIIPQKTVKIMKGTEGNLSYVANWKEIDEDKDPLVEVLGASIRLSENDNNGKQSVRIGIEVKNANKARACAIKLNVGGKEYTVATEEGKGDVVQSKLHSKDIANNSVIYAVVLTNIPESALNTDIGITGIAWDMNYVEYTTETVYKNVAGVVSAIADKYPALNISLIDGTIYINGGANKLQKSDIESYSNNYAPTATPSIPTPTPRVVQTPMPVATPSPTATLYVPQVPIGAEKNFEQVSEIDDAYEYAIAMNNITPLDHASGCFYLKDTAVQGTNTLLDYEEFVQEGAGTRYETLWKFERTGSGYAIRSSGVSDITKAYLNIDSSGIYMGAKQELSITKSGSYFKISNDNYMLRFTNSGNGGSTPGFTSGTNSSSSNWMFLKASAADPEATPCPPTATPSPTPVPPEWNDNYETQAKYELWTPSGESDSGMLGKEVIFVAHGDGGSVYAMSANDDTITKTDISSMYFGDTLYIPTDYNLENISWSTMWNKANGESNPDMGNGYLLQNVEDQTYLGIWGYEVSAQGLPTGMTSGNIDYKRRFTWSSTLYSTYMTGCFLHFDGTDFDADSFSETNVACYVKTYTGNQAVKDTWHQVDHFTTGRDYLLVTSDTPGTAKAFYINGTYNNSYDGKDVTINADGTITYSAAYNDSAVVNAHSLSDGSFYLDNWSQLSSRHTLSYNNNSSDQSLYITSDHSLSNYCFRFEYLNGALKVYYGSSGKDTVFPVRWRTKSSGALGIGSGSSNTNEFYLFERDVTPQDYTPSRSYTKINDV